MSKELFQAIINKQFYLDNKDLISKDLFAAGEIRQLYETIKWGYENDVESLTIPALRTLYEQRYPVETESKKLLVTKFLHDLENQAPIGEKTALLALKQAMVTSLRDEAATILCQYDNPNIEKAKELIADIERLNQGEKESDIVNLDILSLLERTAKNSQWKFNIPALAQMVDGIGACSFTVIAGRVNSGKSLAAISFCFAPNGFAEQGAKILYLCNEEDGGFPGLRAISAFTGMTFAEITDNKEEAAKIFARIKPNIKIIDNARISMGGLNKLVEKYKPDIVVADMLDHIQVNGDYAREDLRLGQLYRQSREIAKINKLAFIGVSQTSAESDGKLHYGFDTLAGSKTDKPAACDLILLLGADAPNEQGEYSEVRAINVAKNKINGKHGPVNAIIQPSKSRLVA